MTAGVGVQPPYPGLRSFRRSETALFFGRESCINAMVDLLSATHFLAVLGSSGTGKSSLVKAGLLDALELGLMAQAGSRWCIADLRPEDAPFTNLSRRLLQVQDPPTGDTEADVNMLRAFITRGPRSIIEWCRAGHLRQGHNLLLLVDQFEELFRYRDYAGREEADAFVALLIESAHSKEFPIYVVITMRSEYLGACALIDGLAQEINAGLYLTPRMNREECRQAIVGPARVCDIDIDDGLVNRLLNDLASFAPWDEGDVRDSNTTQLDRLIRRADQLPLLQYTLNRMYLLAPEPGPSRKVKLGLPDYKGLNFALNAHADQIFESLDAAGRPVEKVFRALTSGTTIADAVRRPTRLDELVAICAGNEEGVRAVVEAYRAPDCNFLLPEADKPLEPATVIDISHESLIRQWKRLSAWLAEEAVAAQQWRRLIDRFNINEPPHARELANLIAWRAEVRPNAAWAGRYGGDYQAVNAFLESSEKAEARRYWLRIGTVAAVFLVVFGAALVSLYQWSVARGSLAQAEMHQARAEANYSIAKDVLGSLAISFAERATGDMPVSEVSEMFQTAKDALDRLKVGAAEDAEVIGIRARVLDTFVDVYRRTSSYHSVALIAALEANSLFRRLIELEPDTVGWRRYLSLNLGKVGDLKFELEDMAGAKASYTEALGIDRALALQEPDREDHPRQIAIELIKLGILSQNAGDFEAAGTSYDEALRIRRKLVELYSILPVYQRDLSSLLRRIGGLKDRLGNTREALADYREALAVDREILKTVFGAAAGDYDNISEDLGRIGDLQIKLGDTGAARKTYDERLAVDTKMAEDDVNNIRLQQRISRSLRRIAEIQIETGDKSGATKSYAEAFAADRRAAESARIAYSRNENRSAESTVVTAFGLASWSALLAGEPALGASYAERILRVDPSQGWIDLNRAHAYLLLGRYDEAKAIYLKHLGRQDYKSELQKDFASLRAVGARVVDIERILKDLGIAN